MSEQQRQQLSALMDGEIDPALEHATLSALESSAQLASAWESYHLIGNVIRSESVDLQYCRIAADVSKRLSAEPIPSMHKPRQWRRRASRLSSYAGVGLAAGAAFLAVFAVPQLIAPEPAVQPPPTRTVGAAPPPQFRLAGPSGRWHVDEPGLETKLDEFLVDHQQRSPASGVKGFLPYATVVGYEAQR